MIAIRVTGAETAFLDLQIKAAKLDAEIRKTIRETAAEYRAQLVATLRAGKSGRRYARRSGRVVYRRKRVTITIGNQTRRGNLVRAQTVNIGTYTASAPGQAPAVASGTMLRSIRTSNRTKDGVQRVRVYADKGTAFYRHFLEFGTGPRKQRRARLLDGKSRKQRQAVRGNSGALAARPVWTPLQRQLNQEVIARVEAAIAGFDRS